LLNFTIFLFKWFLIPSKSPNFSFIAGELRLTPTAGGQKQKCLPLDSVHAIFLFQQTTWLNILQSRKETMQKCVASLLQRIHCAAVVPPKSATTWKPKLLPVRQTLSLLHRGHPQHRPYRSHPRPRLLPPVEAVPRLRSRCTPRSMLPPCQSALLHPKPMRKPSPPCAR
jgi:hypothetical protein